MENMNLVTYNLTMQNLISLNRLSSLFLESTVFSIEPTTLKIACIILQSLYVRRTFCKISKYSVTRWR